MPDRNVPSDVSDKNYDFIAVGDYAEGKAYPWMMQVLTKINEGYAGLKVGIVGRGPLHRRPSPSLLRNGLNADVQFLGWKDETGLEEV